MSSLRHRLSFQKGEQLLAEYSNYHSIASQNDLVQFLFFGDSQVPQRLFGELQVKVIYVPLIARL